MTDETPLLDLSNVNIFIATPCMDGKYESGFKNSLHQTFALLDALNAKSHHVELKYTADVALAREKLMGVFYRHEDKPTHLMFIDADMSWDANDVARMIVLDREFLGAAGAKKTYPLTFCYQLCDQYGRAVPLVHEIETNVAEVSALGGAFIMLRRSCIEKMIAAYPELEFDGDAGVKEYALFDPMIINVGKEWPVRRLSEDYAFCQRWRDIGGKVNCLLDVKLGHTGSHTFTGSFYEQILQENMNFASPPAERILHNNESFT